MSKKSKCEMCKSKPMSIAKCHEYRTKKSNDVILRFCHKHHEQFHNLLFDWIHGKIKVKP